MQRTSIGKPYDNGFLDDAWCNASSILRVSGWSRSSKPTPPLVENGRHLWTLRYMRDDIDQQNAGVFHDYIIDGRATLHLNGESFEFAGRHAPFYDHLLTEERVLRREQIYGTGPSVRVVDAQAAQLFEVATGKVLDFGCGSGAMLLHMRDRGIAAQGIELDQHFIRRDVLPEARANVTFYDGNLLPFADHAFDWVTASEVLEHIDNLEGALAEISRVAPNLAMTVPDATAIARLSGIGVVPWHLLEATHVNFFSPRSLKTVLLKHYRQVEVGQIHNTFTDGQAWSVNLWAIARK